jgi:DNA-binding IclR family transcriptional regulator
VAPVSNTREPRAKGPTRLRSLNSSLDVLEALGDVGTHLGVSELSRTLGVSKATVHMILANLCARGYAVRDPATARYRLGLKAWEIGTVAIDTLELPAIARPQLQRLSDRTGETSHLAVYAHGEALYLDKVASLNPVQAYTRVGGRAPAHCVATGKALLAHQTASEIERVCGLRLQRFTPLTITTASKLQEELAGIRSTGVAINRGEWRQEVVGVAAPIRDHRGEVVAAVGLSGPSYRFSVDRALALGPDVSAGADIVSAGLGHGRARPVAAG